MSRTTARRCSLVSALALVLCATFASAQAPEDERQDRARDHFDRGLTFFNEGRFDAALAEFTRAYELAPAPEALYNIARVQAALGRAVESAGAYRRYLEEGGSSISAARRREAQRALDEQASRVGRLMVRSDVQGATVSIDGIDVATTPLTAPIPLAAGAHIVEVRAPGREPARHAVAIAGREDAEITVSLQLSIERRGTVRIAASLPDVLIVIDGEQIGMTPLETTIPLMAGRHVVSASRRGYQTETREITIEHGAEAELSFDLHRRPDAAANDIGRVRLRVPNVPHTVRVDGEEMLGLDLELPSGSHVLSLEVSGREPYEGNIQIRPGSVVFIVPPLAWTIDERRQRIEAAEYQRVLGIGLSIGGGVLLAAGVPVLAWNESEINQTDADILDLQERYNMCMALGGDCRDLIREGMELNDRQDLQAAVRGVSIAGAILGAGIASIGLWLTFTAPSTDDIDAQAAAVEASLRIGPGSLELFGRF